MPATEDSPMTMKIISSNKLGADIIDEMSEALEPYYVLGSCLPCFPYDFDDQASDRDDPKPYVPPVQIVSEQRLRSASYHGSDMILSAQQMQEIAQYVLPAAINRRRWKRLYSSTRDGNSFLSCMHAIRAEPRTLVVVRTVGGTVLGGYADAPWRVQSKGGAYDNYESVQSCLFSFSSAKRRHMKRADSERSHHSLHATSVDDRDDGSNHNNNKREYSPISSRRMKKLVGSGPAVRVHPWTGKNRNFQCCDFQRKMIAFGGGTPVEDERLDDEGFGLCLTEDFVRGSTGTCDTYDNEPLCDESVFAIQEVEVWGFLTMVKI